MMEWQDASCYLNGQWLPLAEARVPVLDRGFIFGDGVYEVIPVDTVEGMRAPFRAQPHFARLQRSCDAIRLANPLAPDAWLDLLDAIVEIMKRTSAITRLSIEGHTDTTGDPDFNLPLAEARAAAVKKYLERKGFGSTMPLDSNETEEGRAKNRRVEFKVSR